MTVASHPAWIARMMAACAVLGALTACDDNKNTYVAPPPPQVTVAVPDKQSVTSYLESTGNAAAVNTAKLVARVQGFITAIKYNDGDFVKKGTVLFVIEQEPYQVKLDEAKASVRDSEATLQYNEADYRRQTELEKRQVASEAKLDQALANRDSSRAKLDQAKLQVQDAQINLGYTEVRAPFDGYVSARKVSIGALVGSGSATELATIVQHYPIHVTFNVSEQAVLRIRAEIARRGLQPEDLKKVPVEVGLQTESGYPHKGTLDYAAPQIDDKTGTLEVRAILENAHRVLLPGYFVRVRIPLDQHEALLVPDTSLGSGQSGRYVLVVNAENVVEQRDVETGSLVGEMRVIEKGLKPDDRVIVGGLLKAIPGQKVDPRSRTAAATSK